MHIGSKVSRRLERSNANEQLQASDDGALIVVNEAIGERREMRLIS